jgi:hypothetical protein
VKKEETLVSKSLSRIKVCRDGESVTLTTSADWVELADFCAQQIGLLVREPDPEFDAAMADRWLRRQKELKDGQARGT